MTERAIKRNWLGGQRWPTECTGRDLAERETERGDLTLKERAALAVLTDLGGGDARARQIAVRNVTVMESQNMDQEERDNPTAHEVVHRGVVGVQHDVRVSIIQDDNWYGNADSLTPAALEASSASAAESGPVQGGLCGQAIGQNGNGSNGHH